MTIQMEELVIQVMYILDIEKFFAMTLMLFTMYNTVQTECKLMNFVRICLLFSWKFVDISSKTLGIFHFNFRRESVKLRGNSNKCTKVHLHVS